VADQAAPGGRLFRGPLVSTKPATVVVPDRGLPLEFEAAQFHLGAASPIAVLPNARLEVGIRANTVRAVSVRGITLRAAIGPSEHGMFTFRMRAVTSIYAPEEFHRLPQDSFFRSAVFETGGRAFPSLLVLDPATRIVFTLERIQDESGQLVFENPDAIELLWQALGRPSFTQ
jgi:hypothetical protein